MDLRETVSALVDGETDAQATNRAIEACQTSGEARSDWHRFHLVGDALRGELPDHIDPTLTTRISAQIAAEPAILAPRRATSSPSPLRWVAGLAVAASCAGIVVFSGGLFTGAPSGEPAGPGLIAESTPAPLPASPSAGEFTLSGERPTGQVGTPNVPGEHFNPYLVRHSEYQMNTGAPGMNPYARLIGYTPDATGGESAQPPRPVNR